MSADGRYFVDTNVLLYVIDSARPEKRDRCKEWMNLLWENGAGRTSWQVLNEFYFNATGKLHASPKAVRPIVEQLTQWGPPGIGLGLVQQAWTWMDRSSISYWDALIVAAAEHTGCRYLLTEDLQDGREFGGVLVVNPFRTAPPVS
jgi:predicted nucleic acid-binding protein